MTVKSSGRGLYQNAPGGVWMVRRRVPDDVRERIGRRELIRSTETSDSREAERRRDDFWREWDDLIRRARLFGCVDQPSVESCSAAIDAWKRERCWTALAGPAMKFLAAGYNGRGEAGLTRSVQRPSPHQMERLSIECDADVMERYGDEDRLISAMDERKPLSSRDEVLADDYYAENPEASRALATPITTQRLIETLQAIAVGRASWRLVDEFDPALDVALLSGGERRPLCAEIRDQIRPIYAAARAEVVQHEEVARLRAAYVIAARMMVQQSPAMLALPTAPVPSAVAESRKTVAEGIEDLRLTKEGKGGNSEDWNRYKNAYRVMVQVFGADRRLGSIDTRDAATAVALLRRVPPGVSNTKLYRGMTLAEAADEAERLGRRGVAPSTLSNAVVRMGQVFTIAGLPNPFRGLAGDTEPLVERRGFTTDELTLLLDGIFAQRGDDHAFYWTAALALYQGGRQNEMAQLQVGDVKWHGEQPYLDLSVFDAKGVRTETKRLKNKGSARVVPIHPKLIEGGFLDLVNRRKECGTNQLFPELTYRRDSGYGRDVYRWFTYFRKRMGVTNPSTVFHSFRHSWTDATRRADIPDRIVDALAGWTSAGQGAKYGNVQNLAVNLVHLSKIEYGEFRLPSRRRVTKIVEEVDFVNARKSPSAR